MLREESVDIGEIDAGLRACIEELASLPVLAWSSARADYS